MFEVARARVRALGEELRMRERVSVDATNRYITPRHVYTARLHVLPRERRGRGGGFSFASCTTMRDSFISGASRRRYATGAQRRGRVRERRPPPTLALAVVGLCRDAISVQTPIKRRSKDVGRLISRRQSSPSRRARRCSTPAKAKKLRLFAGNGDASLRTPEICFFFGVIFSSSAPRFSFTLAEEGIRNKKKKDRTV